MKRFLCLFFALVLAVSLVACGENNATNTDTTDNTNSTSESGESQTSEPNNTTKNEEDGFSNYTKLSGEKIYVNFSDKRHDDDGAYSKVFRKASITEMDIIAMFSDHVSVSDYKGVLDAFNDGRVFKDFSLYAGGGCIDNSEKIIIKTDNKRDIVINGVNAEQFEGTAGDKSQHYVYGYCFVYNNTPCMLIGSVLNYGEHQDLKTSIKIEVDKMIETVRSER